jgi:hypothetical protein
MELPTMTAKYNMVDQHEPRTIGLLDGDSLSSACRAVLDEAIDRNMVVGTGHIGIDDVEVVVDYVTDREGTVLITHPELHAARDGVGLKVEEQVRLANDGVFFERCFVATLPTLGEHLRTDAPESARNLFDGDALWERFVEGIEATGPARNVISTDLGQPDNAAPPRGLRDCHEKLLNAGISQADLETMARDNPEALFGKK